MIKFALISEGISEKNVISHLVYRYIGIDNCEMNWIQPTAIYSREGEKQQGPGGWLEVINHCNSAFFDQALNFNDYIIVQIDTDCCEEVHYDVCLQDADGAEKSDDVLYRDVCDRLLANVDAEYHKYVIFAICFNEIECWLIPALHKDEANCRSKKGCVNRLNQVLHKSGLHIPDTGKHSVGAQQAYKYIFSLLKKKSEIKRCSAYNLGFDRFISQLELLVTDI